jgi:hypothetical protein
VHAGPDAVNSSNCGIGDLYVSWSPGTEVWTYNFQGYMETALSQPYTFAKTIILSFVRLHRRNPYQSSRLSARKLGEKAASYD